uniref:NADH-quinone oxidoreductase subunit J n=1 Tax=Thermodesulfovibrio aggregans TaxID=86166 RepID=A0A7C4EMZ9_9BACT
MKPATVELIFFIYFFVALTTLSVLVVAARKIIHNAVFLLMFLINTAAVFLFLKAEFLMVIQIIVYVGGVLALYVFAIMIMNIKEELKHSKYIKFYGFGLLIGAALFLGLVYFVKDAVQIGQLLPKLDSSYLGKLLYSYYLLPFEILSVVLLIALVGGIMLAKKLPKEEK